MYTLYTTRAATETTHIVCVCACLCMYIVTPFSCSLLGLCTIYTLWCCTAVAAAVAVCCFECLFSVRAEWLCLLFYSRPVRNCRVVCMLKSSVSLAGALCHRFLNHLAFGSVWLVGAFFFLFSSMACRSGCDTCMWLTVS